MKNHLLFFTVALFMIFAITACKKETTVTSVTLKPETLTLYMDETATLTATVLPSDATNKTVSWTSSDPEIATVSNGTVFAKSAGTATITVTTQEGGFTAECVVTVTQTEPEEAGVVINGVKWATRNLAAHGKFVEKPEDYGALFQWGRKGDGHEQRTSPNYPTNDNSQEAGVVSGTSLDVNGQIVSTHAAYGKFIKQSENPYDWCSPQKDALWNSGTETTPVKTANDPCPKGWRVPTVRELGSLDYYNSEWGNLNGVNGRYFGNGEEKLFLPTAGSRLSGNGEICSTCPYGFFWSSTNTPEGNGACCLCIGNESFGVSIIYYERARGFSVRCVAD